MLFFFNDTATTEIYTLSLHDALPISRVVPDHAHPTVPPQRLPRRAHAWQRHHSGVRPRAAFPACGGGARQMVGDRTPHGADPRGAFRPSAVIPRLRPVAVLPATGYGRARH